MYVVIFRAIIDRPDEDYDITAQKMRELAIQDYGSLEFTAASEGNREIALSYWKDRADIIRWKQDVQHLVAQKYGQEKWYQLYSVEISRIEQRYDFP